MEELLQANQEYNHKFVFDGGEVLTIPVLEDEEEIVWE